MANAIPVSRPDPKPPVTPVVKPVAEAADQGDYTGRDHPELGAWTGHGWHKSN